MNFGFIKVGAYTPEIKVGDLSFNSQSIIKGIEEGEKNNLQALVFPELCITGYTSGDLFFLDTLIDGALASLKKIALATIDKKTLVAVGLPFRYDGKLYNTVALLNNGKIIGLVPKSILSEQNAYGEKRYFSEGVGVKGEVFNLNKGDKEGVPFGDDLIFVEENNSAFSVGIEIGEEWNSVFSPSNRLSVKGATIILNPACIREVVGKGEKTLTGLKAQSLKTVTSYVRCESGEGESTSDGVFSGYRALFEKGKLLNESTLFTTGLTVSEVDVSYLLSERSKKFPRNISLKDEFRRISFFADDSEGVLTRRYSKTPFVPTNREELNQRCQEILQMQAEGLKRRILHTHSNTVVIGLSGGLDSTLALIVAVNSFKFINKNLKEIIAVTMPCFGTTGRTFDNSVALAKSLGVILKKVDIAKAVKRHLKDISHDGTTNVTYENAQARERTQVLMDIANMYNGLVIGTGDLSEMALGWCTYNGDHMSMYAVNCSIPRTLVRILVEYYKNTCRGKLKFVLEDILDTPVSPELLPADNGQIAQKTEDIVGPYILHDFFLYNLIKRGFSPKKTFYIAKETFKNEFSEETVLKWLKIFVKRFFTQQFKRSCVPDGVGVGSLSLSPRGGWCMPSDASYNLWLRELETITI